MRHSYSSDDCTSSKETEASAAGQQRELNSDVSFTKYTQAVPRPQTLVKGTKTDAAGQQSELNSDVSFIDEW
jgi:hypothetical protein